jgi:hypothetical protein
MTPQRQHGFGRKRREGKETAEGAGEAEVNEAEGRMKGWFRRH